MLLRGGDISHRGELSIGGELILGTGTTFRTSGGSVVGNGTFHVAGGAEDELEGSGALSVEAATQLPSTMTLVLSGDGQIVTLPPPGLPQTLTVSGPMNMSNGELGAVHLVLTSTSRSQVTGINPGAGTGVGPVLDGTTVDQQGVMTVVSPVVIGMGQDALIANACRLILSGGCVIQGNPGTGSIDNTGLLESQGQAVNVISGVSITSRGNISVRGAGLDLQDDMSLVCADGAVLLFESALESTDDLGE